MDRKKPGEEQKDGESRLERIRRMGIPKLWVGDPDDIFHMDWLKDWREEWGLENDPNDPSGKHYPDDKPKL